MSSLERPSNTQEKATRDAFGETLKLIAAEIPEIVVLDSDSSLSSKSHYFAEAFPDRFFQMGIAEANMVGTAAGLSFSGLIPFACSFGAFITGRYETIRISVAYSRANVKLVGTHSGLGIGEGGHGQMALEDISLMRGLPGMVVIQPADHVTTAAAVRFAATHRGPVYLRLTSQKLPLLYRSEQVFQCGRGIIVKEGKGIALIASGATVSEALKASEELSDLNPWVIDIHTIKPLDRALIKTLVRNCQLIATIEDHTIIGGLGSAVAEVLAEESYHGKFFRLGLQDVFGESGDNKDLYEKYGFSSNCIVRRVREATQ